MCWYFRLFDSFASFAADMANRRNTTFHSYHSVEFCLQICERIAGSIPVVATVVCRLYEVFGNSEAVVRSKRSCLDRVN